MYMLNANFYEFYEYNLWHIFYIHIEIEIVKRSL